MNQRKIKMTKTQKSLLIGLGLVPSAESIKIASTPSSSTGGMFLQMKSDKSIPKEFVKFCVRSKVKQSKKAVGKFVFSGIMSCMQCVEKPSKSNVNRRSKKQSLRSRPTEIKILRTLKKVEGPAVISKKIVEENAEKVNVAGKEESQDSQTFLSFDQVDQIHQIDPEESTSRRFETADDQSQQE